MPYHEFTTRGQLHRRSNAVCGHFDFSNVFIPKESEIKALERELKDALGAESFYLWVRGLPAVVVGSQQQYIEAAQERLQAARAPQQPTQLFLFRLNEEYSSVNSVAQESAGVTILDGEA